MILKTMMKNPVSRNKTACFISAIFKALEKNHIIYCVLRNYCELPDNHGNDVDILINDKELKLVRKIVLETAKQESWIPFAVATRYGYTGIHLHTDNERILIDIFSHCHWRGLTYADEALVLESRNIFKGFWVAGLGCEGAITLVKELLSQGKMKQRPCARDRVQLCVNQDRSGFITCIEKAFSKNLAEQIWEMASEGNWKGLEKQVSKYRRILLTYTILRMPASQLMIWMRFILGHILYKLKRPLGIFIVLIGPDGSGKTSIAKKIMSDWEADFHTKPFYIHGDFHIMPRLGNIKKFIAILTRRKVAPEPDFTKRHSGANVIPHSLLRSLIYLIYYFPGYLLGHLFVFWAKGRDKLIIADRYFYDYFFQRGNMKLPHRLLKALSLLIPRPNATLYLDSNAREIYQRKDELTIEEIQRQQNIITQINNWLPNFNSIKSDIDIKETIYKIKNVIYDSLETKL
jgi:thymidylate kinase